MFGPEPTTEVEIANGIVRDGWLFWSSARSGKDSLEGRGRMRRGRAAWIACCALLAPPLGFGCACAPRDRVPSPAAGRAATPLFWQARSPDGGAYYLLGSVHVGSATATPMGVVIEQAYARSQELVVEVDMSHVTPAEVEYHAGRYASLPSDVTLDALLSSETRELLASYVESRNLPAERIQGVKPWFASTLILALEFQAAGYDAALGVDRVFIDQADGEKPIVGLETIASQLAMLDGLPLELQELMLKGALLRLDDFADYTRELLGAWASGDESDLEQRIFQPLEDFPELSALYEAIYWRRNASMTARLVELAGDGQTRFVVLGAGHMVGDKGIPALLAAQGFIVERIDSGAAALPADTAEPAAP
jgi:uncharacterized protein YbaP (TraB family)